MLELYRNSVDSLSTSLISDFLSEWLRQHPSNPQRVSLQLSTPHTNHVHSHTAVTWAQRSSATDPARNFLYLTINAPDVDEKTLKLDIQPTHIDFSGYSKSKKLNYKVKLDFFAEIDPAETKSKASARGVDLIVRKKEAKEEFWPRLTKEKQKLHFLRTDFDKWVDEDEQDEKEEDPYADYMGGGGMPGMPGMGGMGDMGGMGGMGGIGKF